MRGSPLGDGERGRCGPSGPGGAVTDRPEPSGLGMPVVCGSRVVPSRALSSGSSAYGDLGRDLPGAVCPSAPRRRPGVAAQRGQPNGGLRRARRTPRSIFERSTNVRGRLRGSQVRRVRGSAGTVGPVAGAGTDASTGQQPVVRAGGIAIEATCPEALGAGERAGDARWTPSVHEGSEDGGPSCQASHRLSRGTGGSGGPPWCDIAWRPTSHRAAGRSCPRRWHS
jgi:hypothetical protein